MVLSGEPANTATTFNAEAHIKLFKSSFDNLNIKMYNILGQEIAVKLNEINSNTINCETATSLPAGLYQVVITKDNSKIIKKWIKE